MNKRLEPTSRVTDAMRDLIVSGELLPGQQIRQEQMAARFGVSRLPIREALTQLVADGLATYEFNLGYSVARLSRSEFDQVYLIRRLLEGQVIATLEPADDTLLHRLRELNDGIAQAADEENLSAARVLNRDFHFAFFDLSPLTVVVAEVKRIWARAMPYHSISLLDPAGRARIIAEHISMIEALASHDLGALAELMDQHREGSGIQVGLLFR